MKVKTDEIGIIEMIIGYAAGLASKLVNSIFNNQVKNRFWPELGAPNIRLVKVGR